MEGGGVEDVKEGGGEGGLEICEAGVDDDCDEVWGLLVIEVGGEGEGDLPAARVSEGTAERIKSKKNIRSFLPGEARRR